MKRRGLMWLFIILVLLMMVLSQSLVRVPFGHRIAVLSGSQSKPAEKIYSAGWHLLNPISHKWLLEDRWQSKTIQLGPIHQKGYQGHWYVSFLWRIQDVKKFAHILAYQPDLPWITLKDHMMVSVLPVLETHPNASAADLIQLITDRQQNINQLARRFGIELSYWVWQFPEQEQQDTRLNQRAALLLDQMLTAQKQLDDTDDTTLLSSELKANALVSEARLQAEKILFTAQAHALKQRIKLYQTAPELYRWIQDMKLYQENWNTSGTTVVLSTNAPLFQIMQSSISPSLNPHDQDNHKKTID